MSHDIFRKIQRGMRKPPRVIANRIGQELRAEMERFLAPVRASRMDESRLLAELGFNDLDTCWAALAQTPFASAVTREAQPGDLSGVPDRKRVFDAADRALNGEVDLMGSGPVALGGTIDWHKDYKTGFAWTPAYFRSISYNNLDQPSDVKFPWELSRLQWLIPVGQAFALTQDERYATGARDVLEQWIAANPYAHSVNWACTMEVALRILGWTWLFHIFHASHAWRDAAFRGRFLRMLYLHGDFTARHLERSDVNGNHFTADAAGLVFAGLFFGERGRAAQWGKLGWQILVDEMPKQVFADGVDFEASIAYHRLVLELFLFPALYRMKLALDVPTSYRESLLSMARFAEAYSRADGSVPLWGDADDARALPFGGQGVNDHRYLVGLIGLVLDDARLLRGFSGDSSELWWWLGPQAATRLLQHAPASSPPASQAFPDGGFYVMRNLVDHVFIDCGPLGLAGRGGHGHNDALSFEAALCGVHLVTDSGSYLYTGDYRARNRFRSTASHNTPMVDGQEINRFIRPDYLWNLHDDARPELIDWRSADDSDFFKGQHRGYRRLATPVTPVRTIELRHAEHRLVVLDEFVGSGEHAFRIPLHLATGTEVVEDGAGRLILVKAGQRFRLHWQGSPNWSLTIEASQCSPSYGRLEYNCTMVWSCRGRADKVRLQVVIAPTAESS